MFRFRFLAVLAAASTCLVTRAERLLNEPFDYPDGPIINVAPDLWKTHSGTAGQVDVSGGVAIVTGAESEDVNRSFTGTGISTGTVFASFDLTLDGLPSTSGTYFFHFKDTVDTGAGTAFIGRVYTFTSGAEAGKYRVGISWGSAAAVPLEKDLDLNTAYRVVVRLNLDTLVGTLWINPTTDTSTADRADTIDTRAVGLGMSQVAFRQSGGIGNVQVDNLLVGTRFADVAEGGDPTQNPPTLTSVATQRAPAGTTIGPITLQVADGETAAADLTLSAESSDTALVPLAGVTFGGAGTDRTVTVQPAPGAQGTATVTVVLRDTDGNTARRAFDVIVGEPSISGLKDIVTVPGTPAELGFTVSDSESDALTVTASAADSTLLTALAVEGTGANRTLKATPDAAATGLARVEVVVTDGFNSVTNSINITVAKKIGVILDEPFDYPDETLLNLTGIWLPHSGTNDGPVTVRGGKAQLVPGTLGREDVNITYNSPTVRVADGVILYARLDVVFSAVPTAANGTYFAHYLGTAGGSFRGRIFAGRRGQADNQFQIGLANNSATASAWHPKVVTVGQPITVVVRYNVSTGTSTLWVNPDNEGSPSVDGTDAPFPSDMVAFALRQDTGYGSVDIDAIKIGTSYEDVLTPVVVQDYFLTSRLEADGTVRITFPAAAAANGFAAESATGLSGPWTPAPVGNLEGDRIVLVVPAADSGRLYRLRR